MLNLDSSPLHILERQQMHALICWNLQCRMPRHWKLLPKPAWTKTVPMPSWKPGMLIEMMGSPLIAHPNSKSLAV